MSASEALWLGHPVAHIAAFRERQRLEHKRVEALRALDRRGLRRW